MGRKRQHTGGGGYGEIKGSLRWALFREHNPLILLSALVLGSLSAHMGRAACPVQLDPMEEALATVQGCMARAAAPWPDAWQQEYVDTIQQVIASHADGSQYNSRLQVLCDGFPAYWEALDKKPDRSVFEVQRAQIRWYIEYLMEQEFPGEEEIQLLRNQYRALAEQATCSLLTQFPFLDPNQVQKAKTEFLGECYRNIDAPLQPIFLLPYSAGQADQIKQRWDDLRYARVDLWRQLPSGGASSAANPNVTLSGIHPHYLLTQRSLAQLRLHLWTIGFSPPEYYRRAVAERRDDQKRTLQSISERGNREGHLPKAVLRTEYVTFLLAAVLETARYRDEPLEIQTPQESPAQVHEGPLEQTDAHASK